MSCEPLGTIYNAYNIETSFGINDIKKNYGGEELGNIFIESFLNSIQRANNSINNLAQHLPALQETIDNQSSHSIKTG